jgi:hypothetical protein
MNRKRNIKRRRRNRTPRFPERVFVKTDERAGFDYASLLAEVPFDESSNLDLLESRAARAGLKPCATEKLTPKQRTPFANLGTKTIGDDESTSQPNEL